jgi:hypothetical protein
VSTVEKFERKITIVDIVLMALALVSLGLLLYEEITRPPAPVRERIVLIDLVIVGIFALEFTVRVLQSERKLAYIGRHWYDLIGMIPVAHPVFRSFRLARFIRLFVIASRFLRATDRTLGEAFVHGQIAKYRKALAEELTDPILIALLGTAQRAVTEARIGTALAKGLSARRDELAEQALKPLRDEMPLLLKMPGIGHAIERLPGRMLDSVVATLGSKETDEAISTALRTALESLEQDLSKKSWRGLPVPPPALPKI